MNILQINYTDQVGGRFTGFYMNNHIKTTDTVEMAVWDKASSASYVHLIPPIGYLSKLISRIIMSIGARLGFDGLLGTGGWLMPFYGYFKHADIIHLHIIHNYSNISILSLPLLSRLKPIVWTIHDPWAITGGCEHSFDCNKWLVGCSPICPYPRRKSFLNRYLPYVHWKIKQFIYKHSNLTLVVASSWMKSRINQSPLFKHLPCHQIPFGVDLELFRPRPMIDCLEKFGIPPGSRIIAFRDVGLQVDHFKGMKWLFEALEIYTPTEPTCLLILQDGASFKKLEPKYSVIATGWIDGDDLACALSVADVFVMPSIQETFGLMAVEAMACGTPVIVFEGTALPGVIKAPDGGFVVPSMDSLALASLFKKILPDPELLKTASASARIVAEKHYDYSSYLTQHIKLYHSLLSRDKPL